MINLLDWASIAFYFGICYLSRVRHRLRYCFYSSISFKLPFAQKFSLYMDNSVNSFWQIKSPLISCTVITLVLFSLEWSYYKTLFQVSKFSDMFKHFLIVRHRLWVSSYFTSLLKSIFSAVVRKLHQSPVALLHCWFLGLRRLPTPPMVGPLVGHRLSFYTASPPPLGLTILRRPVWALPWG